MGSGLYYLTTWKCIRVGEKRRDVEAWRLSLMRRLRKFGPNRQVKELNLKELLGYRHVCQKAPLVRGGPAYPFLAALVAGLWMWRGQQARSLMREQISVHEDMVTVVMGVRKNNQAG